MDKLYALLFAIFAFGNCYAASFDCYKAKGKVEELICEDEELSRLDELLLETYKAVLAVVLDQGALKADQRRWISKLQRHCKEGECLLKAYEERISMLENTWDDQFVPAGIAASKANSGRAIPFEGEWMKCQLWKGEKICSSYTLMQKDNRVCGEWEYWATYHTYSGQLQASLRSSSEANIKLICGTPGSETSIECDDRAMSGGSWERVKRGLSVCDGRLIPIEKSVPCSALIPSHGFFYHPLKDKDRKRLFDQLWVKRCLADG